MTLAQQLEQKGLQQGRREEDFVIAKRMLARGSDREFIKDVTGLSDQDLLSLED
jgi:recombination-promoting nuclease RpnB